MRVLLIHAPADRLSADEPPRPAIRRLVEDPDFQVLPLGLLSLAASLRDAGHGARILNLSTFAWEDVRFVLERSSADLFGISTFTASRHGAGALAALLGELYPDAHLVVGGPLATALPEAVMRAWPAVDSVVVGEGERTMLDLLSALERGRRPDGIPGLVVRAGATELIRGPSRDRLRELDELPPSTTDHAHPMLVTARGCPSRCAFCASESLWGRRVAAHSPSRVLDDVERLVAVHGRRTLAFKDEVFTLRRRRALEICERLAARRLDLRWSCDTRVDRVDPTLLAAMREAGCRLVSFGVESGAPEVLERLNKRANSPERVVAATTMARDAGLEVRWYLLWGSPGETPRTIEATLRLIDRAKPTAYVWYPLAVAPGAPLFDDWLEGAGETRSSLLAMSRLAIPYLRRDEAESIRAALGDAGGFHVLRPSEARFRLDMAGLGQPTLPGPLAMEPP